MLLAALAKFLPRKRVGGILGHASTLFAGIGSWSTGQWVAQQAWNMVMDLGDRLRQFRTLARDRDDKYIAAFDVAARPGRPGPDAGGAGHRCATGADRQYQETGLGVG